LDVVFPGHAVEACPGLDVVADRAVYVVHVPNFADMGAHRARVRALGRELRRRNYRAMLVHLSDEGGDVDDFYEPWPLVLRQYFDAALAAKWGGKLLFLPLGYASGHGREDAPSARRPVTWAFVGDAKGKPTRRKMLAALGAWPRGVSHVTSRSTVWKPTTGLGGPDQT